MCGEQALSGEDRKVKIIVFQVDISTGAPGNFIDRLFFQSRIELFCYASSANLPQSIHDKF